MGNVKGWQQGPKAVNLREISVDFRSDKEDRAKEDGYSEAGYQRIGLGIKLDDAFTASEYIC